MSFAPALPPETKLLESLLWQPGAGYFLLDRHLERLQRSAQSLGFPYDAKLVQGQLQNYTNSLRESRKVRLTLDDQGVIEINDETVKPSTSVRAALALTSVSRDELLLRHKTTDRRIYADRLTAIRHPRLDDVLLWNEQEELTETSSANIVLKMGDVALTPRESCGLLAGTYRAELLASGEIQESVLPVSALAQAKSIWLINSVRRWCPIEWVRL